jgi:hypothetical protein
VWFNLFHWAYTCVFCSRPVCSKCITEVKYPVEKPLCDVLVSTLADQLTVTHQLEEREETGASPGLVATLERGAWNRLSLRAPQMKQSVSENNLAELGLVTSRPKLTRWKTMGKAEVERVKGMKLSSQGAPQRVCLDCREMLTKMIR